MTTLRVEHYTPDVTVSTWHDPATHPWRDYGRLIAQRLDGVGERLARGAGGIAPVVRLDSAGTKTNVDRDSRNFLYRGVDAIGNPVNFIQGAFSGSFGIAGSGPGSVPVPTPAELAQWFTQFPAQVAQQWASVPSTYTTGQTSYARQQINDWSGMLGLANGAAGLAGQAMQLYDTAISAYTGAGNVLQLAGGGSAAGGGGGGAGASSFMCPPGIAPFALAFQSDLDALVWRNILPLETIYPATWLPGMREVGQGMLQTWGSVWPRQGMLFQQDPVKGAAVLAQRVGDIISHRAQPHIYTPLQLDNHRGYRFFGFQGIRERDTRWQRVYPNPQRSCEVFGRDDSLSVVGFGDGHNLSSRGTVWNAWRRQECCSRPSGGAVFFLGSIGG